MKVTSTSQRQAAPGRVTEQRSPLLKQVFDHSAITAPILFVESQGRCLAYRSVGEGPPLILCVRFHGVLDVWDPAFIDALAKSFRTIIFDYGGLGQSAGTASYNPFKMAEDVIDLADGLGVDRFIIGGWSLGGQVAQVVAALHSNRIKAVVLIGTCPPGRIAHGPEPVFFQTALKFDNDLHDETILFFEPTSPASREATKTTRMRIAQRTESRSPAIPEATYLRLLTETKAENAFADETLREKVGACGVPILVISADHEIVFPVQNWFDLVGVWHNHPPDGVTAGGSRRASPIPRNLRRAYRQLRARRCVNGHHIEGDHTCR